MIARIKKLLRDMQVEWGKVSKPDRKTVQGNTLVVVVACLILGVFLGIVDGNTEYPTWISIHGIILLAGIVACVTLRGSIWVAMRPSRGSGIAAPARLGRPEPLGWITWLPVSAMKRLVLPEPGRPMIPHSMIGDGSGDSCARCRPYDSVIGENSPQPVSRSTALASNAR